MKTVQYYLNNLNLEKIVDTYYNRIEDSLLRDADNNITIEELKLTVKYNIVKYIEKLKSIEIKKGINDGTCIFFNKYRRIKGK